MATLLDRSGLRLFQCCWLRVIDVDFGRRQIAVRRGQGDKDRVAMPPAVGADELATHLVRVREQHLRDVERGAGLVELPDGSAIRTVQQLLGHRDVATTRSENRVRAFVAVVVVTLLAVVASCNDQQLRSRTVVEDTPENRRQAAQEYLRIVPPGELMQDATDKMAESMSEPLRTNFVAAMAQVDLVRLNQAMLDGMVKRFTVPEINALSDFYGSTEGRSVMKKFGAYMSDVMPVMQAEIAEAMTRAKRTS